MLHENLEKKICQIYYIDLLTILCKDVDSLNVMGKLTAFLKFVNMEAKLKLIHDFVHAEKSTKIFQLFLI